MLMKKIFTLLAVAIMALCANAQSKTATFGASSISGLDKDTDVPCEGFTLAGTYFAAGTSKVTVFGDDKGMKVRANKGADANQFALTVNEGCIITKLEMGMVVNDASSTFTLSGISVDGTPVADFTAVALPNTADADGSAVVNLDNIKATQDITFTFNFDEYTGKNKQVFIAGEVTYEEGVVAPVEGETMTVLGYGSGIYGKEYDSCVTPFEFNYSNKQLTLKDFLAGGTTVVLDFKPRNEESTEVGTTYDAFAVSGLGEEEVILGYYRMCPINDFKGSFILKKDGENIGKFENMQIGVGGLTYYVIKKDSSTDPGYLDFTIYCSGDYSTWNAESNAWEATGLNYVAFEHKIPLSGLSAIETVAADFDENAPVEYYNLQGVRVANPANGIFIKRQGNKVEKVLVK